MKKLRYFIAGCLVAAVLSVSLSVFAEETRTIEALFGYVKLIINGRLLDEETLLYNGTTYIPLRASAEILDKEVVWDDYTHTVYISDKEAGTPAGGSDGFSSLEKININTKQIGVPIGGGIYSAFSIEDLHRNRPWTVDSRIETLPVFANPFLYDVAGYPVKGLSASEMQEKVRNIASSLGLEVGGIALEPPTDWSSGGVRQLLDEPPIRAESTAQGIRIVVEADGRQTIWFLDGMPLPDEYGFTAQEISAQQAKETLAYLLEQYAFIIKMDEPALDLYYILDRDGRRNYYYTAYENSGSLEDRILGDSFSRIEFIPNERGTLWVIRRTSDRLLTEKIGDYPIITVDTAKRLLLEKHFLPVFGLPAVTDETLIAHVELTYAIALGDTTITPYYRFFVEAPTVESPAGMKTFFTYYVPAVDGMYILNMPLVEQ